MNILRTKKYKRIINDCKAKIGVLNVQRCIKELLQIVCYKYWIDVINKIEIYKNKIYKLQNIYTDIIIHSPLKLTTK